MSQQGDVLLFQTIDDGDINVVNGVIDMSGGLGNAVYLSLFGGNENDDGIDDNPLTFWGNFDEIDPAKKYKSETQYLLRSIPAITVNLRRIEDAANRDLSWLTANKIASGITVTVTIPSLNFIKIIVVITAYGLESEFEFVENWKART